MKMKNKREIIRILKTKKMNNLNFKTKSQKG